MPGILGKKIGMTSVYTEDGTRVPVTAIEAGPCKVYAVRTKDNDGYEAVQLGFGAKKEKHVNKPEMGNFTKAGLDPARVLREFKNFNGTELKVGDEVKVDIFTVGEKVKVTGTSKGKGFQGVVKRHGFAGVGGRSHGQHNRERAPGSVGQSSYPSRIFKGIKMAGRTGGQKVTTANLRVVKILPEKNLILVKGATPGAINSYVEINK